MRETDPHLKLEQALMQLMPAALSNAAQAEMESQLDELMGGAEVCRHGFLRWVKWPGVISAAVAAAAAVAFGFFALPSGKQQTAPLGSLVEDDGMLVLTALDHVENVCDEGLFVDAGGSAIRKMSVRVVGESRVLDEETGIEVTLTEPRKEMYLLPVSSF